MFDGMDSEALLAIPFFLLVGELMSSANVVHPDRQSVAGAGRAHSRRPVAGRHRLQHVLLGDVGLDHRRRRGHEPRARRADEEGGLQPAFIAAIIAAASTIAALVPPSITAVVYGAVGNVSIAGLFMAGVVPGLMIGFGLMIYCYFFGPAGMRAARAVREVVRAPATRRCR